MTFEGGKIEVQQHICQKNEEITYDEILLEEKDAIIIRSMTYFAPPDHDSLKKIIPTEYHDFLHLFSEELAAELPRKRQFDHAIDIVPGNEVPFSPIYSLSEPQKEVPRE